LAKQDLCVLVNVALERDLSKGIDAPPEDFFDELGKFVRQGHGLIVFAGENVKAAAYNRILGKAGLLPLPLKGVVDRPFDDPLLFNRDSVALAAYQPLKESESYKLFGLIPTWKAILLDEADTSKSDSSGEAKSELTKKKDSPLTVTV